jgi:beta-lactamase regulating signal transducer with metallopeptidase domain/predicted esterase
MNPSWLNFLYQASADWLVVLGQVAVEGSLFILLIWVACRTLPQLPAATRCCLWWLVCLKLMLGLAWGWSIPVRILPPRPIVEGMAARFTFGLLGSGEVDDRRAVPNLPTSPQRNSAPVNVAPVVAPAAWPLLLSFAWACGVLLFFIFTLRQGRRFRQLLTAAQPLGRTHVGEEARRLAITMGLTRPCRVVASGAVTSPIVVGPLHPVVVLPHTYAEMLQPAELRMVLAHELAHIRRHDLWLAVLPALSRAVFFFLPPMWLAFREWAVAREAACDREALLATGASPVQYTNVLLKVVSKDHAFPPMEAAGALGATTSFHTLRARLLLIKAAPPIGRTWIAISLAALVTSAVLVLPWRLSPKLVPQRSEQATVRTPALTSPADIQDVPVAEMRAEGDRDKLYLLIGAGANAVAPTSGYRLLLVLPGGDGSAEFQYFVRRIRKHALSEDYLIAQLVAPSWSAKQFDQLVWPTTTNPWPAMRFSTEEFVEAVVRDVARRNRLDRRYIFALGWSSGGPPVYAQSLSGSRSVTGSFAAMSIFHPDWLPPLSRAKGRPYFLLHSPQDRLIPFAVAQTAQETLRKNGANVHLQTYQGGHGWRKPVYEMLRRGIRWLEEHHASPP